MDIKDLTIGDKIRETNPNGYYIDSIVEEDPVLKKDVWFVTTIAPSNEFLEYRQTKDGIHLNHIEEEIKR